MIQKIKDLMKINELITEIGSKVDTQNKKLDEFANEMFHFKNTFNQKIKEINDRQLEHIDLFSKQIKDISELKSELSTEINDIKLQKTQAMKKMMETANDEFEEHLNRVKTDVQKYNDVKNQVTGVNNTIASLQAEVSKFIEISKGIKKEDFELTKYANKITSMDKEKLELMAKIDSLERLISKMRRSGK